MPTETERQQRIAAIDDILKAVVKIDFSETIWNSLTSEQQNGYIESLKNIIKKQEGYDMENLLTMDDLEIRELAELHQMENSDISIRPPMGDFK